MSGLINKIEEKLGGSSNRDEEPTKLQKTNPNASGGSEYVQHPISSTGGAPTGTAVDGYSSNYTTSTSQHGTQGSIPTSDVDRRVPGSWETTDRTTGTSGLTQGTSTTSAGPRQPFDPYTATGQQTAANAVTTNTDVPRAREGGVLNSTGTGNPHLQSSTVASRDTVPVTDSRYGAGQTTSSNHYGRDAGIVGGSSAAGIGAYEASKRSGATSNTIHEPGRTYDVTHSQDRGYNANNVSYMNRDNVNTQHHSNNRPFLDESSGRRGGSAVDPNPHSIPDRALARKMGAAYEAGYRDALEHLRAEYNQDNFGRSGASRTNPAYSDDYRHSDHRFNDQRFNDNRSNDYRSNDYRSNDYRSNDYRSNDYRTNEKPSLGEKLNPKVDADGDGKAGIMS